jgi:hypothetical protein
MAGTGGGGLLLGVHVTVIELESSEGLHIDPLGTGPSPTVSVTVAGPGCVQVKSVLADVVPASTKGALKEPVDDVQANVSIEGSGPLAVAESVTDVPTFV